MFQLNAVEAITALVWARPSQEALPESITAQRNRVAEALSQGDDAMALWQKGKLAFYENDHQTATDLYTRYFKASASEPEHLGLRLSVFSWISRVLQANWTWPGRHIINS